MVAAIIPTKKAPPKATVPDVEESPARRSTRAAAASAMARSTPVAADAASDDDSEYKAAACEDSDSDSDSDSDEAFAAAKPNPGGGTGMKPSKRKGKVAKKTAAMQAEKPPPAKKAKTPTEKVCLLIF